ncbi:unnamed protein product [Caenorhabditis auriculariae]|uniref:NAD-dependent protein deacetylase n=1 Tax=Caenorhabditis auriculariae TaxID=2777116 RepID=A0A8S1HQA8_9PELO|nr:unnamed protein product [Caenorhabditis auriculariae]
MFNREKVSNIYSKFVQSFENALNTVVYGEKPSTLSKLSELSLKGVANYIKECKPKNVIVMTGAGTSTSAGIPDFRSSTGVYSCLQEYNLPHPQAIFDISYFESHPEPFFRFAKTLFPKNVKPTPAHYFVKLLEKKGILKRWYTQNIDALEFLAGMPEEKVVTAHGSHLTSTCRSCGKKYDRKWMTEKIFDPNTLVPHCDTESCRGVVKPDIIFFGEALPRRFMTCSFEDFPKCDLLIIMGTSLVVQPFAALVHEVADDVPRLLINLEDVGGDSPAGASSTGLCYARKDNMRDVFWKGTCDEGVKALAELLDWELELQEMIAEGEVKFTTAPPNV